MAALAEQMAERRERILESARRLMEEAGYDGLTMRDLAEAAGVTVPTIYNLIGPKEQVLLAAVEDQTRAFVAGLERAAGDLLDVVEAAVRQMVRRPRYYRSLLVVLATSPHASAARRHVEEALAGQIERAVARVEAAGALAAWVDRAVLAERLHAHLDMAALEWARGTGTAAGFRAAALFDAATTMLGMTTGAVRQRFEQAAREHQPEARTGRHAAGTRGQAA
jgi:AcrR family transcriptional regulator